MGIRIVDSGEWPKPCANGCGKRVRPPHTKAHDYPDTVAAASNDGWCCRCSRRAGRMGMKRHSSAAGMGWMTKDPATAARRLEQMRADYDAMVRSRRARGIPPQGILMPGENGEQAHRQAPLPQGLPVDPLGLCPQGHPYTHIDRAGRKVCGSCMRVALEKRAAIKDVPTDEYRTLTRKERGPRPGAPLGLCELGHPYTAVHKGGGKYCKVCGAARRARNLRAQRKMSARRTHREGVSA